MGTGPGAHGLPRCSLHYPPKAEFAESKPPVKLEQQPVAPQASGWVGKGMAFGARCRSWSGVARAFPVAKAKSELS